ncbi:uncharacterized protein PFL1_00029 [Pseudozyma flocculosa PF-1]|uniref:Domain of unknown function at the cortex 1 domain-containing protein n=1 Tax=Pseudozyma flocculosa TaxID=84751 RepID=A0A5C3ETA5_9BASI|nr:uncharacterized protein PFL1_00029 [Pseudozyma flocculosa PF-1]EPQ31830.1 hypothetical protein PFL1_00029 [Pseudozyma flocculosa PF-1]SPO35272.1 uncharacterized protein PSFLO_00743 [Pseudozyma flocculosa]
MPQLQVMVGPDRFHLEPCRLNDTAHPHEIENEHFIGRVLVRILDAPGARQGEPGREYFQDRSRKFCIQIEGRFKQRHSGNDILFGTDFDKLIDFPRAPFNAGMRVARMIDPATFYDIQPASGRPYIMSPYIACMNTICAWPAPSRAHDAVVVLRHTHRSDSPNPTRPSSPSLTNPEKGFNDPHSSLSAAAQNDGDGDEGDDIVPAEQLHHAPIDAAADDTAAAKKKKKGWLSGFGMGGSAAPKEERVLKRYWRFVGFRDEPRVRALLDAHHAKLSEAHQQKQANKSNELTAGGTGTGTGSDRHLSVSSDDTSTRTSTEVQHAPAQQTLSRLGTSFRRDVGHSPDRPGTPEHATVDDDGTSSGGGLSLPVSPRIGSQELATAPPADVAEIASPRDRPAPAISSIGTVGAGLGGPVEGASNNSQTAPTPASSAAANGVGAPAEAAKAPTPANTSSAQPSSRSANETAPGEPKPELPKLERITTDVREEMQQSAKSDGLRDGDFKLADALQRTHLSPSPSSSPSPHNTTSTGSTSMSTGTPSKMDAALGPWRFSDPGTDMVEDNAFIFTNKSLPVPKRRRYFADARHRDDFHYDPDVVYATSFFTDAMDFNTFNLGIGPVRLNLHRFFVDMPVRYTLRSARDEEATMVTISFQLV